MQANENITQWFDRYTTIINQLNQLGKIIPEDELVKRLIKSLPKTWRSTVVVIREAKYLNKISLDEICGYLFTYKQEMNQMEEKEKKVAVDKKKSLPLIMSWQQEKTSESSCEDEEDEMTIVAKRYKKLVL